MQVAMEIPFFILPGIKVYVDGNREAQLQVTYNDVVEYSN